MRKLKLFSLFAAMLIATSTWATINCTTADIGKILCTDGTIYANGSVPSGKTAAAMICYVNTQNRQGLAIALKKATSGNVGYWNADSYISNFEPKVTGETWVMPTKDDWQNAMLGCRKDGDATEKADQMKCIGLYEKCEACGNDIYGIYYLYQPYSNALFASNPANFTYIQNVAYIVPFIKFDMPVTSTVTFNKQSGTGGTASVTATYGSPMPSATMPTRTGYTFGGYFTETGGKGTKYYNANGSSAKNWDKTANTTLYAQWTANKYTVTLDMQGGAGGTNSVQATYNSPMPSATMPTRAGYTFGGYYTGKNGSGNRYYNPDGSSVINWNKVEATTLYAKWTIITYSISITLNGGHWIDYPTSYTVESSDISLKNLTRDGYTFKGWTGSNGNTPQKDVKILKGSTGNKNYTANWDPIVYNITYDYAGGEGNNPATYTIETPTFSLNNPTRLGYTFVGWTGSNGYIPQMVVTINQGEMYDNSYTAHWEIDPSTNVAYLDSLDQTAAQETAAFHRPEAPEVPGFTFLYWQVEEGLLMDGIYLQAVYSENEPSSAPKKQVGKFTLTRQGDKNEYILQFAK